jgi:two-component system phosphate regulon sensor histidine kinase PhoR
MADKKLRTAGWLMTISIVLLLLFQAYWLRNAYHDEFRRLKRELAVTFRETVLERQMQELFKANGNARMEPGWEDTSPGGVVFKRLDSISFKGRDSVFIDSQHPGAHINIMVATDSPERRPLRPGFLAVEADRHFDDEINPGELTVQVPVPMGAGNLDSVAKNYRNALQDGDIHLAFTLQKKPFDSTLKRNRATIQLKRGQGRKNQFTRIVESEMIEASFANPFFLIARKMQWQLLFALTMLVVTLGAFIFLFRNLRQQHRLAQLKNDFIANITHELKTPVATVSVAIEALKNFNAINDAKRTKEYLDISSLELQRLNMLVDKVLKLSMFEQNKMELQQEKIDMQKMLADVLSSMKLQFEKQDALISLVCNGEKFLTAGDRMHLQSVLFNLLDNALKYSPSKPQINIELNELPEKLQMKIADNGIGIAPEYRQKVFGKFFRVPHGNIHDIKGYGLGLSYAHEVIQRHKGSIYIESNEGPGTIFIVELPKT